MLDTVRIDHLLQDPHESRRHVVLNCGDLVNSTNLIRGLQGQLDEMCSLGVQSDVLV